jgi:lysophospholipase L1-like esterase
MSASFSFHKLCYGLLIVVAILVVFVIVELLITKYNGGRVPVPTIPREPQTLGSGKPLAYLVLGDSSAVGHGGEYAKGIAINTAHHLAKDRQVSSTNLAVSGATTADVQKLQLPKLTQKPDVVLIAIGSNDVTHLSRQKNVQHSLEQIIATLIQKNCEVKIVLTGSAAMGTVPRFPQPMRWFAGRRVIALNNNVFAPVAQAHQLTFAALAAKTGPIFAQDPSLFAIDKFHPNDRGYAVWTPVLNQALDQALATQPSHCAQ